MGAKTYAESEIRDLMLRAWRSGYDGTSERHNGEFPHPTDELDKTASSDVQEILAADHGSVSAAPNRPLQLTISDSDNLSVFLGSVLDRHQDGSMSREGSVAALLHVIYAVSDGNEEEARTWFKQGRELILTMDSDQWTQLLEERRQRYELPPGQSA